MALAVGYANYEGEFVFPTSKEVGHPINGASSNQTFDGARGYLTHADVPPSMAASRLGRGSPDAGGVAGTQNLGGVRGKAGNETGVG